MRSLLLLSLLIPTALTACANPNRQPQQMAAYCTQLGFPPGNAHYWDCIDRLMVARGLEDAAAARNSRAAALAGSAYLLGR